MRLLKFKHTSFFCLPFSYDHCCIFFLLDNGYWTGLRRFIYNFKPFLSLIRRQILIKKMLIIFEHIRNIAFDKYLIFLILQMIFSLIETIRIRHNLQYLRIQLILIQSVNFPILKYLFLKLFIKYGWNIFYIIHAIFQSK